MADEPEDLTGSDSVPAASSFARGTAVVLVDVTVPSGSTFELDAFANYADDVLAFSNCYWTILVDGMRHSRFTRIRDQLGLQVNPRVLPAGLVKARSRFQVIGENAHTTDAFIMGASIQGRYVPNAR